MGNPYLEIVLVKYELRTLNVRSGAHALSLMLLLLVIGECFLIRFKIDTTCPILQ